MPLTMPDPRYFSMPSAVVGGAERRKAALNWRPCVRSLTQIPLAWTNSPAVIAAATPTRVTRSRWPRALTRSTQKPVSGLWKVTRSTSPASASRSGASDAPGAAPDAGGPARTEGGTTVISRGDGYRSGAARRGRPSARPRRASGAAPVPRLDERVRRQLLAVVLVPERLPHPPARHGRHRLARGRPHPLARRPRPRHALPRRPLAPHRRQRRHPDQAARGRVLGHHDAVGGQQQGDARGRDLAGQ